MTKRLLHRKTRNAKSPQEPKLYLRLPDGSYSASAEAWREFMRQPLPADPFDGCEYANDVYTIPLVQTFQEMAIKCITPPATEGGDA